MKLHPTATQQYQTVTAYTEASIEINAVAYEYSLIVMPEMPPVPWKVAAFDALSAQNFEPIAQLAPDVVILGTGTRQHFMHPKLHAALSQKHIGVECMDNKAACRTYNILMVEGRRVALALILS